ncbi:MAG: DUF2141 domain-containing protein [Candidatus Binatia bacterium]
MSPEPEPCTPSAANLILRICGLDNRQGNLNVAVFSSERPQGFTVPDSEDFATGIHLRLADAEDGPVLRVPVARLRPGSYAVRVMHDENGNGKVDFGNIVGTPQEPYGYSRNRRARMSAVSFEEAAVVLGEEPLVLDVRVVRWSLTGGDSSPCPP